jgi:alpha-1,3/alpha-1,6-mannosyltransferase
MTKNEPIKPDKLNIAFVHPDLGIGGAERLVVDAALGLIAKGHSVQVFTSHHDIAHCFPETNTDMKVTVLGDWLPRSLFGKGHIFFAMLRSIYLAFILWFFRYRFDAIIVDQMSYSIIILRELCSKVIFYCHFPDKLLSKKSGMLKTLYRLPFDFIEEITTRIYIVMYRASRCGCSQ